MEHFETKEIEELIPDLKKLNENQMNHLLGYIKGYLDRSLLDQLPTKKNQIAQDELSD